MTSSASRRILVTGATGFIGSRLVSSLLGRGDAVIAMVRGTAAEGRLPADVERRRGDLGIPASLRGACEGADAVMHLASRAETEDRRGPDEEEAHRQVTVEGTRRLLAEARAAGVRRFVFMSSVKAMGEGGADCLDEATEPHPVSAYGRAKLAAEALVAQAGREGMETVVLRLPMVYGPNPKGSLVRMIAAVDAGRFPPLPEVGNRRSMVHVEDAVTALLLAAGHERAPGHLYIVTDGLYYSTRQIYLAICRALGRTPPSWTVPKAVLQAGARMGDALERLTGKRLPLNGEALEKLLGSACYRSDRIARDLDFRPAVTLEQALPEMVRMVASRRP